MPKSPLEQATNCYRAKREIDLQIDWFPTKHNINVGSKYSYSWLPEKRRQAYADSLFLMSAPQVCNNLEDVWEGKSGQYWRSISWQFGRLQRKRLSQKDVHFDSVFLGVQTRNELAVLPFQQVQTNQDKNMVLHSVDQEWRLGAGLYVPFGGGGRYIDQQW